MPVFKYVTAFTVCAAVAAYSTSSGGVGITEPYSPEAEVSVEFSVAEDVELVEDVEVPLDVERDPVPIEDVSVLNAEYTWLGKGDDVRELQQFLNVDVDGVYGPATRVAHLNFLAIYELSSEHVPVQPASSGRVRVNAPITPKCTEWWPVALQAGWSEADLPKLGHIMFRESTCQPDAISPTNDYGLTQINWAAHGGRLSAAGITRQDLLDPLTNLIQAKVIADSAASWAGCKWQPWYMSGNWCG